MQPIFAMFALKNPVNTITSIVILQLHTVSAILKRATVKIEKIKIVHYVILDRVCVSKVFNLMLMGNLLLIQIVIP